jgi:cardiolipin synthase
MNLLMSPSPKRLKQYLLSLAFAAVCAIAFWIQNQQGPSATLDSTTPIALYANQTQGRLTPIFSQAIEEAQHSVLLIVYSLNDPYIIQALKNKSAEGKEVKVICDAEASPRIEAKLQGKVPVIRRFGPGLMHQKILVTDKENVWIGSANMTTDSLQMHGNLVIGLQSRRLADFIYAKANTMTTDGKSTSFRMETFTIGGQQIEMWFLPDNPQAPWRLKTLMQQAKKSIRIAMFTWTRRDFAKTVVDAARRGIQVEVVIDRNSGKGAGAPIVAFLQSHGVNVRLSTGTPLLHHKFLYIDGNTLVNGSANWTKKAFTQNDDCFIVMHDLTEPQHEQMESLWKMILSESAGL